MFRRNSFTVGSKPPARWFAFRCLQSHTTRMRKRRTVLFAGVPQTNERQPPARDEASAVSGQRSPSIWYRVLLPSGAIGPGKIDLLRLVAETGSVSAAARRLRMSHARSVKLVSELNALGHKPLIETKSGGEAGGGSRVTPAGQEVLEYYDALDRALQEAAAPYLAELVKAVSHD